MLYGYLNFLITQSAKIMDGGRIKWEREGRELTKEAVKYSAADYKAPGQRRP